MGKPRWLNERQQHLWHGFRHVNQDLFAVLDQQLAHESGLSGADYKVLHELSVAPDGLVRARDLGCDIGWDRSRLSHHLSRMEKRGLVTREECAQDGRGLMVRLTDAGREAIEGAAPQHAEHVRRYFFDLVSDEELGTTAAVFERGLADLP